MQQLEGLLQSSAVVVGLRYQGLTVKQLQEFRRSLPKESKMLVCKVRRGGGLWCQQPPLRGCARLPGSLWLAAARAALACRSMAVMPGMLRPLGLPSHGAARRARMPADARLPAASPTTPLSCPRRTR